MSTAPRNAAAAAITVNAEVSLPVTGRVPPPGVEGAVGATDGDGECECVGECVGWWVGLCVGWCEWVGWCVGLCECVGW